MLRVFSSVFNSSATIMVSWSKPLGGDKIDQYCFEWFQEDSDQRSGYKCVEHISGKINYTFTITNLQFETKYKFVAVAKNSAGYGPYKSAAITTGNYCVAKLPIHIFLLQHHYLNQSTILLLCSS